MKKNISIFVGLLVLTLAVGFVNIGCSSTPETASAEDQLRRADNYFQNNNFNSALPLYVSVSSRDDIAMDMKAYATFRVGRIYDIQGDVAKSNEWYTRAADMGNSVAQLNLGNYYHVINDYDNAFRLYLKSAEQGEPQAEYNVFVYYMNGIGMEKDADKAAEWLLKAYQHGSKDAENVMRQWGLLQ